MNSPLPQVRPVAEFPADVQAGDHTSVVIVGAGACGLTAALALHRLGMDCVVLERDAFAAGSTALSSGFIPAPGTQAQRVQGITDSVQTFAADIQAKAHGQAAPHLVQAYAQHIGPAMDALAVHHGLPWQVLDNFLYPGHSAHRMHAVPEKTGAGLMSRLQAAADAAGVVVLTQAQVTELWSDEGRRIHGVGYMRPNGQMERIRCDAVLLACNGFGGAAALVKEMLPEMAEATYAGHVGNDGSAMAWGQQLGARLADLGAYQGHGSWAIPQGALISMRPKAIQRRRCMWWRNLAVWPGLCSTMRCWRLRKTFRTLCLRKAQAQCSMPQMPMHWRN